MFLQMLHNYLRAPYWIFLPISLVLVGVTAVALLAESHISIHTWPENGVAVCDVFTCGEHTNPRSGATYMYEAMGATDIVSEIFNRPLE